MQPELVMIICQRVVLPGEDEQGAQQDRRFAGVEAGEPEVGQGTEPGGAQVRARSSRPCFLCLLL